MKRSALKRGKPLQRKSPMKRGKGISEASPAQRAKVKHACCLVCGRDNTEVKIDPAHLWPRGKGGCDDPRCVVPLCRDHHRMYEEHKVDLLPILITAGFWTELAHPIAAHEVSPTVLVGQLTGERYVSAGELEESSVG